MRLRSRRVLQVSSKVSPGSCETAGTVHNPCYYRQMGRIFPQFSSRNGAPFLQFGQLFPNFPLTRDAALWSSISLIAVCTSAVNDFKLHGARQPPSIYSAKNAFRKQTAPSMPRCWWPSPRMSKQAVWLLTRKSLRITPNVTANSSWAWGIYLLIKIREEKMHSGWF